MLLFDLGQLGQGCLLWSLDYRISLAAYRKDFVIPSVCEGSAENAACADPSHRLRRVRDDKNIVRREPCGRH